MPLTLTSLLCMLSLWGQRTVAQPPTPTAKPLQAFDANHFESRVRPLLVAQCLPCHSEKSANGGVRLDQNITPELAQKMLVAVRYTGKVKMPAGGKLQSNDIVTLEKWAIQGAAWPASNNLPNGKKKNHWSFFPPRREAIPIVANATWSKNPVDAFLFAAMAKNGAVPAPAADKRTLIRRVSLDLTGLPPSPAEVNAFLTDASPDAYTKVVDRLLSSPAYGEKWARHWLDVARYADSNGLDENLAHGYAYRYRDWVVGAINSDLPYDKFVQYQIAGDLLPAKTEEDFNNQLTATGFLTLGPKVLAEQDKPKLVLDIVDEQIDVVTKSTMGLTVACARCHDHKFDPISQKDYYALAGIFKSTKTMANLDFVSRWNERDLKNAKLESEKMAFDATLTDLKATVTKAKSDSDTLTKNAGGVQIPATSFVRGNVTKNQYGPETINTNSDDTFAEWEFELPSAGTYRIEVRRAAEENRPSDLLLDTKTVSKRAGAGVTGGWNAEDQRWTRVGEVEASAGKHTIRIERNGGPIPHFSRLAILPVTAPELGKAEEALQQASKALKDAEAKRPKFVRIMAVDEAKPEDLPLYIRGNHLTPGDVVPRGFPKVLCAGPTDAVLERKTSGRLEFARWLTRPEHALTSRVAVNRMWQNLFGVGLMHTPSNWGLTGEMPTNQALLDWLAVTFVKEDKWSQKAMLRRLALSQAYQQASIATSKIQEIDPDNRLWTRMPLRRMSAEMLRDSLHSVSGTLDKTIGGTLLGGNDGDYVTNDQSGNKAQYDAPRRSLYLPVIRNAVYDFFQAFDFGDPSLVNARRASTIVAPQALFLLNSPLVANQARAFATSVESIPDETARLENIYERAYSREPTEGEITRARIFMLRADELLEAKLPDPSTRLEAIWAAYCHTILASNEMVYVR
jgi:Protein of unknown function (DUF1549)/Protein of unknown function (DUF1553)